MLQIYEGDRNKILLSQEPHTRDFEKPIGEIPKSDRLIISQTDSMGCQMDLCRREYPLKLGKHPITAYMRETVSGGLFSGQSVNTYGVVALTGKYRDCGFLLDSTLQVGDAPYLTLCFKALRDAREKELAKTTPSEQNPWYIPKADYESAEFSDSAVFPYQQNRLVSERRRKIHVPAKSKMGVIVPIPYMATVYSIYLKRNTAEEIVGIKILFN